MGEEERSVQRKVYFHTAKDLGKMKVMIYLVRGVFKTQIKKKRTTKKRPLTLPKSFVVFSHAGIID